LILELSDEIHARVVELSDRGDKQADRGDYADAIRTYRLAWDLLPKPRTEWKRGHLASCCDR